MRAPKKPSTIGEAIEETKRAFAKPLTRELPPKRRGPPPPPLPAAPEAIRIVSRDGKPVDGSHLGIDLNAIDGAPTFFVKRLALTDGGGPPHVLAGPGSSGKTLFCQDLLLSLAAEGLRCLHLDLEQGSRTTRRRYQRFAASRGIDLRSLQASGRLTVECFPPLQLSVDRGAWLALMTGRDLVLVDSLRAATRDLDENSSAFRKSIDFLTSLSEETKCRAILTHHVRKATKDAAGRLIDMLRGSTAIQESADCIWQLMGDIDEDEAAADACGPQTVYVRATNTRPARDHGEKARPFAFVIADVPKGDDAKWGLRIQPTELAVLRARSVARAEGALATADAELVTRVLESLGRVPETAEDLRIRLRIAKTSALRGVMLAGDRLTFTVEPSDGGRPRKVYRVAETKAVKRKP
jgi:KaiC/GvpD/RAD55 family RecA-like ATPase